MWVGLVLLDLCFCAGAAADLSVTDPVSPDLFVLDANGNHKRTEHVALTFNSHITLICRSAAKGEDLQWQFSVFDARDFKPVISSSSLTVDDAKRDEIVLRISKVRFSMAGTYQCSNKLASRQINIHVYGILSTISSSVQLMPKRELVGHFQFNASVLNTTVQPTVGCQFRVGRYGIKYTSIRWKGGKFETHRSLYELTYSADEVNGYIWSNLTIVHPSADPDLYGKYTCQFNVVSGSIESADVEITIAPLIRRPDHVVGHYSGNAFSYTCEVVAYPPVTEPVSWSRNDEPILMNAIDEPYVSQLDWSGRVRFETVRVPNDRIVFDPVMPEDRAVYTCFVRNPLGNATGAIFLRVKDRWAVFWPLIGIVLEVIVMFVVIFVYEMKQRAKKKREADLNDDVDLASKPPGMRYGGDAAADDMLLRQRI